MICCLLNIIICNFYNLFFIFINRCGILKEFIVLIGIVEKVGDMKVTVEVINGRGGFIVVRRRIDIVNYIISLKILIGKLFLN